MLDASYVPAYNQLGIIYEAQGLADEAEELYLKAISIDPNYLPAYSNLALLNEAKNELDKAIKYWQKRVELGDKTDLWTQKALERLKELQDRK